jgi:ferredoxin
MKISRRQFFRLGPAGILRGNARHDEPLAVPVRPPGALADAAAFAATCQAQEGCTACFDACPHDAIQPLGPDYGALEDTPHLELVDNPCRWCQPMVCIEACDEDALRVAPDESPAPIAKVHLDLADCMNTEGTLCSDCSDFCPTTVRAMTSRGREPKLDVDRCVGCGLCIWHCDASGTPLVLLRQPMDSNGDSR